jgi:conjugative transfer pilus assembly protein TraH
MSFPPKIVVAWLLLVVFCAPAHAADPAGSGISTQMSNLFDTMLNYTAPTAHLGQRRGVLTGGSVNARNRIMNESLWHFVPPSFNAGCGGIDLFAGSFSFISAEQFQTLLRAIAANAAGYAFEVALGAMCKECLETMETLQKKIQALNQGFAK